MPKTILHEHYSCSVKKTAPKKPKYSRNETILKVGDLAKAIAHAKAVAFARWPILKIASILECLGFFWSAFWHRTTLVFLYNAFSHLFGIFNFWPKPTILQGL